MIKLTKRSDSISLSCFKSRYWVKFCRTGSMSFNLPILYFESTCKDPSDMHQRGHFTLKVNLVTHYIVVKLSPDAMSGLRVYSRKQMWLLDYEQRLL